MQDVSKDTTKITARKYPTKLMAAAIAAEGTGLKSHQINYYFAFLSFIAVTEIL